MTNQNILVPVWNSDHTTVLRYECKCGSVVKPKSVNGHLKTKKHKKYLDERILDSMVEEQKECNICYNSANKHYQCRECKNTHCIDCHVQITNKACPFCRTTFETRERNDRRNRAQERRRNRERDITRHEQTMMSSIRELLLLGINPDRIIQTFFEIVGI